MKLPKKKKKKEFEEMARDALMVDIYIYIYIYMPVDPQHLCKFHVFWYC